MTSRVLLAVSSCSAALIFTAGFLSGCGANSPVTVPKPPGSSGNVVGNWVIQANLSAGGSRAIAAYLVSNASTVTGTAAVEGAFPLDCENGCCGGPFAQFNGSLSGSMDADNRLKLGSAVAGGGPVFAMTATASGGTLTNGSFTLTGSCAAQGTITGTEYPTLGGTWAGTMTSQSSGKSFTISLAVNQSSALNSRGYFDVTGTAKLSGYACATSAAAATPLDGSSGFLGNSFSVSMNAAPSGTLVFSGALSPDGKTVAATYEFVLAGSPCHLDSGKGTLTLQ